MDQVKEDDYILITLLLIIHDCLLFLFCMIALWDFRQTCRSMIRSFRNVFVHDSPAFYVASALTHPERIVLSWLLWHCVMPPDRRRFRGPWSARNCVLGTMRDSEFVSCSQ